MGLLNTNNSYLYYSQEFPDYIYSSIDNDMKNMNVYDDLEELTNKRTTNDNIEKTEKDKEKIEIYHNIQKDNIEKDNKKLLERKRKGDDSERKHDKFYDDNTIKRIKRIIITELKNFINKKIKDIYGDEVGEGMTIKELMLINQEQIKDTSVEFNKEFLSKTLKDIFSVNISKRITNYPPEHNKNLINEIINDENEERSNYFKELFNISFYDCLKYFRGDNINNAVFNESKSISDYLKNCKNNKDEEYTNHLKQFLQNYEEIITNRKPRKKKNK